MRTFITFILMLTVIVSISAGGSGETRHETVDFVDLQRFSGDWYVIALIPTSFEKKAVQGVENYSVDEEGLIRVEYTFRKKSAEGKLKTMTQVGWVQNTETNAEWLVRPLWPLKLPYFVLELAEDYSYTVIATEGFDYLWIMARTAEMDEETLSGIIARMVELGFAEEDIRFMDQGGVD